MDLFTKYLEEKVMNLQQRARLLEILTWAEEAFPHLEEKIGWNQPMLTDHGTFIISFAPFKKHLAVAPEIAAMKHFSEAIAGAGYSQTESAFRIGWDQPVDYSLLAEIVAFNIEEKKDFTSFWRKAPNSKSR